MTGIATGSIGTEGHAVAKPLQAKKRALARLGSTATGLSTYRCLLCAIARQRRVTATPPRFDGAVERAHINLTAITLLACGTPRLSPGRQGRLSRATRR